MKAVKFVIQGQFGNNLFQYFAAEIIKKIYNYDEIKPTFEINLSFNTVIDDIQFKKIIEAYINGEVIPIDTSKDILLWGYFQRSEIFMKERDYVKSLFNTENMNNISNRIKIGNICKYKTNHKIEPTEKDLTLHVRLGDFWNKENNTSQIFNPDEIKDIIRSITYDKLYIVCNKPDEPWEKEYLSHFEEFHPIHINGNLGDDFDFLMKSKKIILSASTMSWMAAYLGNPTEVHIPYNTVHGGYEGTGQSLAEFGEECKVYWNMTYWTSEQTPSNHGESSQGNN